MHSSAYIESPEHVFLSEMADLYGFSDKKRQIFLARFDPRKFRWKNTEIADFLCHQWNSDSPVQILQDNLRVICQTLSEEGCQINDSGDLGVNAVGRCEKGKSPWQQAYRWLWEQKFSEWSTARSAYAALPFETSHPKGQTTLTDLPFGDRGRITDESRFFDREELLRQIFEELGKGSSISLVGESEIGKSSILTMVCQKGPRETRLSNHGFILINMECVHGENDFFDSLCYALGVASCRGGALRRAVQSRRYVLCLDEIEKMTRTNLFTGDERSELRGLADGFNAPFSLVIASRTPLDELFPDSPVMTSPLAGLVGRPLVVGNFTSDIAHQFLLGRLKETEVDFTEAEISQLISETKGHPAHLQQAAAKLYRDYTQS